MLAIVLLSLFGIAALLGLATVFLSRNSENRGIGLGVAIVTGLLFAITWVVSSVFYVEARAVGIIHEFGKPSDKPASTGLNWDVPWSNVDVWSTGNQPLDFDGDERISFKLTNADGGSEGEAWVNLNASWQITGDETAINLWKDRKEFERVKNEVVLPNIKSAIVGVMGRYSAEQVNNSANIPMFNKELLVETNKTMNPLGIKIEGIAVTKNDLSDAVKLKLEQKNSDKVENERAVIQQGTALVEADTNRIKQANLNDLVIKNNCLEITNSWDVNKNGPLPAGWNCMDGVPIVQK